MLRGSDLKKLVGDRLSDQLPYESYDSQTKLFYNKGTTGFVLLGNPLVGASLEDQDHVAQFLKQEECLPIGSSLQFLLFASPYIDHWLTKWLNPRLGKPLETLARRRANFLRQKAIQDQGAGLIRDYRVMISYSQPGRALEARDIEQIRKTRQEVQAMLKSMGMETEIAQAEDLLGELSHIANLDSKTAFHPVRWNEHEELSKQIFDHDMLLDVEETGLYFPKTKLMARSYVPKVFPEVWALAKMDRLFGNLLVPRHKVPCPFILHYGLTIAPGQGKTKAQAATRMQTLENALRSGWGKIVPNLDDQMDEAREIFKEFQEGSRAIVANLSMTVFAKREQLSEVEQNLKLIWNNAGCEMQAPDGDHFGVYLSTFPMTGILGVEKKTFRKEYYGFGLAMREMSKGKKTISREAQNMLPIIAEWKGQNSPGMPLVGRRGQLFFFNPFASALLPDAATPQTNHNFNIMFAGQTGSGKSMMMNDMMATVISIGGRVFVLDYGRSFKKSCKLFGGDHIEFDIQLDMSLNPFSRIPVGEEEEVLKKQREALACIKPIIQVMTAPKNGTTDLQNGYIAQAIQHAWETKKTEATIDTIVQYLKDHPKKEAQDIAECLTEYTSKGSYGHFFNRPATINFNKKLVVIETDDLRNYPDLMAVVVQMLILQINLLMAQGDRLTPFLIIIDEAWKLLAGKDSAAFISDATRTARKYKGAIVLATQHLTDYFKPESPAATEAFNCSAWKCILYQEPDVIASLEQHDQLRHFVDNPYKMELLKSVHSRPPHYSEVAIFGPDVKGVVGRLCLDPFSRLLYSTNPAEYQAIEKLIESGATVMEAVEIVADMQERQHHAA